MEPLALAEERRPVEGARQEVRAVLRLVAARRRAVLPIECIRCAAATSTALQPMYFKALKQSMRLAVAARLSASVLGQHKGRSDALGLPAATQMDGPLPRRANDRARREIDILSRGAAETASASSADTSKQKPAASSRGQN